LGTTQSTSSPRLTPGDERYFKKKKPRGEKKTVFFLGKSKEGKKENAEQKGGRKG